MKKLLTSLAIGFAITIAADQLTAAPIINHNMTSADEVIYVYRDGGYVYITIDGKAITVTDYTGVEWGSEIVWGTDWFSLNTSGTRISVYIWPTESWSIPRQARIEMKDSSGKKYMLRINQNPYYPT